MTGRSEGTYYVWHALMSDWRGREVELRLDWSDGFPPLTITCQPIRALLPERLNYHLTPMRAPLLDQIWSASKFDAFSPAARELIREFGTPFEEVPATIRGRAGGVITNDYAFVHITQCVKAVDWERSDVDVGTDRWGEPYVRHARRLVLKQQVVEQNIPVFRLDEMGTAIVASEAFRREWERRGLTGAWFRPLDPFSKW